jgi:hypothetical protein
MQLDTVIKIYNITQVILCTYITERVSISTLYRWVASDEIAVNKYSVAQEIFSYETEMFVLEFQKVGSRGPLLNQIKPFYN